MHHRGAPLLTCGSLIYGITHRSVTHRQAFVKYRLDRHGPTAWAFRCRERAAGHLQKAYDHAREAVNCNAVLGGNAIHSAVQSRKRIISLPFGSVEPETSNGAGSAPPRAPPAARARDRRR